MAKTWLGLRMDGWLNALTRLGDAQRDKRLATVPVEPETDFSKLHALYRANALAARIVDRPARDATREGFEVSVADQDDLGRALQQDYLTPHNVLAKIRKAIQYARAFGAGYILLGVNDGKSQDELITPLDYTTIRSVDQLAVFHRFEVQALDWFGNPFRAGDEYGKPKQYIITPRVQSATEFVGPLYVHASRVLAFTGHIVSPEHRHAQQGAGDAVLYQCDQELRAFGHTWQSAEALVADFSQAVFKMRGLSEAMATDRDGMIQDRLRIMDTSRSVIGALALDADLEDFDRKTTTITGLPELLDRFALILAAVAEMPVSLLMGQAPAGLQATGDSDIRWYYDNVRDYQTTEIQPELERLIKCFFCAKNGPTQGVEPERWSITWRSLWQLDDVQKSQRNLSQSQADFNYYQMGLPSETILQSRFGSDGYSLETKLDEQDEEVLLPSPAEEPQVNAEGEVVVSNVRPLPGEAQPGDVPLQESALNGAQLSSALEIIRATVVGEIPRESAVTLLQVGLGRTAQEADRLIGPAGRNFKPPEPSEGQTRADAEENTNFPRQGEDAKVSMRNSQWQIFDPEYARNLKQEWPEIWSAGGNVRGNSQYEILTPVIARGGSVESLREERAVRRREAWAARHFKNKQLPGVIALVKWYVVGDIGEKRMKEVIEQAKDRIRQRQDDAREYVALLSRELKAGKLPFEEVASKVERLYSVAPEQARAIVERMVADGQA